MDSPKNARKNRDRRLAKLVSTEEISNIPEENKETNLNITGDLENDNRSSSEIEQEIERDLIYCNRKLKLSLRIKGTRVNSDNFSDLLQDVYECEEEVIHPASAQCNSNNNNLKSLQRNDSQGITESEILVRLHENKQVLAIGLWVSSEVHKGKRKLPWVEHSVSKVIDGSIACNIGFRVGIKLLKLGDLLTDAMTGEVLSSMFLKQDITDLALTIEQTVDNEKKIMMLFVKLQATFQEDGNSGAYIHNEPVNINTEDVISPEKWRDLNGKQGHYLSITSCVKSQVVDKVNNLGVDGDTTDIRKLKVIEICNEVRSSCESDDSCIPSPKINTHTDTLEMAYPKSSNKCYIYHPYSKLYLRANEEGNLELTPLQKGDKRALFVNSQAGCKLEVENDSEDNSWIVVFSFRISSTDTPHAYMCYSGQNNYVDIQPDYCTTALPYQPEVLNAHDSRLFQHRFLGTFDIFMSLCKQDYYLGVQESEDNQGGSLQLIYVDPEEIKRGDTDYMKLIQFQVHHQNNCTTHQ